ncbi:hypothetical protein BOTBODRAFT_63024 [Botryobasidium botryosum FD-172 SS1]|uniref:Uncharacterized protein n=1 Tax=Botryobasidium botryosum (strain FD-172 SS1) TaxID=930990 RepID=A0A067N515_BOTB1|nr:hypothetical protein BOTBODRAFT_63024 [Botryobasidium botryosum FD-172 SS1]
MVCRRQHSRSISPMLNHPVVLSRRAGSCIICLRSFLHRPRLTVKLRQLLSDQEFYPCPVPARVMLEHTLACLAFSTTTLRTRSFPYLHLS